MDPMYSNINSDEFQTYEWTKFCHVYEDKITENITEPKWEGVDLRFLLTVIILLGIRRTEEDLELDLIFF